MEDDDTTKKPVVPAVVAEVVTSAPVVAEKPAVVVPEPVKTEEVSEVPVEANEIVAPVEAQNDEKVAEVVTEVMPEKVEAVEAVNEVAPVVESDTVVAPVVAEVASQAPVVLADAPAATPVKATSEEEGLLEGIINTLAFDDADDGKKHLNDLMTQILN